MRTVHLHATADRAALLNGHVDAASDEGLVAELCQRVGGEVRFDPGSRALYATDHSIYRQVPIGVVIPRTIQDVVETVAICRRHGAPVLGRGGGTSLAGQTCNVAVVIDFSKYVNHILDVDPQAATAVVQRHNSHLDMKVIEDEHDQKSIWHIREAGVGSSRVPNVEEAWPSCEDSAVPPEKVGDYLRDFERLVDRFGYHYTLFGHFGQGCLHTRIAFGLRTAEGIARFRRFMEEASDLVLSYGGSLSGEHGDGQAKGELLPKMFGDRLIEAFREFKRIWDPEWKMNPGKIVDANPLDSNVRVGPDNHPMPVLTYFKFPDDRNSFATATERCFGIGKCRRLQGGGKPDDDTMCPSFMVTRDEQHCTRGRAHLLFEMMRGEVIQDASLLAGAAAGRWLQRQRK